MTLTPKTSCYMSKFITTELASLFSQSDDEEEFAGFSDGEKQSKDEVVESEESDMDTGFYSEDEAPLPRRNLCVALKFPSKRAPSKRAPTHKLELPEEGEGGPTQEEGGGAKNIMENKAMLAQLFADLSTMAELTPLHTPQKRKSLAGNKSRLSEPQAGSQRRNPSRKARPPEHFGVEERPAASEAGGRGPRTVDIRRLLEVDEDGAKKRRVSRGYKRGGDAVVRSVDEITQEDLDNIAYRAKDKIWDKDHGSSCHQCRQKTLDTKTVCRSGSCVGVKGQFCAPCLKNRYGEDLRQVLLDPTWACPLCRGVCNCSLCRRREGRCATGILVGLARYNGHDNVHQYLQR
ncbi:hypothetical protein NHX12_023272 [Muraenolepis orangiensis]|uniref:Zinc-finger domain-containing protein n=1 Tax=Muraenolepis orangiensis TaxID=630683 RepID=A0A9Q0IPX2_9TELE|nr:hypothetical protein NHX12_023272 [Muraenolepis orangiensis]